MTDDLDAWLDAPREVRARLPKAKKAKGAWRYLKDGSPSSDGIHADIAGACRLMWGPPASANQYGAIWWSIEQRGRHNAGAESRAGTFMRDIRGAVAGTPEFILWHSGRVWFGEIKRPGEPFTPAQKAVHPQFEKAGCPIEVWRSRDEFVAWVLGNGIPHRHVRF